MSDRGSSAGTVLAAFMIGALAGAAVALLYAPATGEETRRKLAELPSTEVLFLLAATERKLRLLRLQGSE